MNANREVVLILDFGSQYTQLIARRCREEGVFSLIEPWDYPLAQIQELAPAGLILSGGPASVYDAGSPQRWGELSNLPLPILGICYGMQMMIRSSGGEVIPAKGREYGRARIKIQIPGLLLDGFGAETAVWMSHGDQMGRLPDGWELSAVSDAGSVAAVAMPQRGWYGVQFHPEVSHTPAGGQIIRNFLYHICAAQGGWNVESFIQQAIRGIQGKITDGAAICALSGGVDSSVAATLARKAIGDRLHCVFVDNGLLRKDEAREVETCFKPLFGDNLHIVKAGGEFLRVVSGVADPERKRKLIGRKFIEVFKRQANRLADAQYLIQGTLYPDVIESASSNKGPAAVIKTHHNVGGLPEYTGFTIIEPLRDLFKDEVRAVGRELGLPDEVVMRHPFPGPGLAVRIIGAVTGEDVQMLQEADAIFIQELRRSGWYERVSQAFAALLSVRSVGVMGDGRTYERVVALRAVDTRDFMTADFSPLPHDLLARVATRITGEVRGINRVVYDVTSKPPATVEWE